ncbi:MAG: TIR domain-containing protein [Desulfococcaceae bacterium]
MTVFISYAPNDRAVAEKLHADLKKRGLNPWMADTDLLPGQKKEETIRRTIRQSTYFLAVLSAASFSQRGAIHKEIRQALDLLDEFPDSDVFVIPLRTDNCPISHEKLENLVPVDLFPDYSKGIERLLLSLSQTQRSVRPRPAENTQPQNRETASESKSEKTSPEFQPLSPMRYAWISLAAFLLGLILLSVFVNKAADPNVSHRVFYVLLIPVGLCTAAFLFGAMRSYAVYSGKVLNGMLEIGGPAVIAILTVIGGFLLVPDTKPFDMTVFVHGSKGQQDAVIRNKGMVTMDLDGNRRSESIGEKGQAYFSGIPAGFINQEVLISVEAEGFEMAKPGKTVLKPGSIYVEVKPDGRLGKISGKVRDADGKPLPGAGLSIGKLQTVSDAGGWFEMEIPPEMQNQEYLLEAYLEGYPAWRELVPAGDNQTVVFRKKEN